MIPFFFPVDIRIFGKKASGHSRLMLNNFYSGESFFLHPLSFSRCGAFSPLHPSRPNVLPHFLSFFFKPQIFFYRPSTLELFFYPRQKPLPFQSFFLADG